MICGITIFTPSFPFGRIFIFSCLLYFEGNERGRGFQKKRWHYTFLFPPLASSKIESKRHKPYNLYLLRYMNGVIKILPIPLTCARALKMSFHSPIFFSRSDSISYSNPPFSIQRKDGMFFFLFARLIKNQHVIVTFIAAAAHVCIYTYMTQREGYKNRSSYFCVCVCCLLYWTNTENHWNIAICCLATNIHSSCSIKKHFTIKQLILVSRMFLFSLHLYIDSLRRYVCRQSFV